MPTRRLLVTVSALAAVGLIASGCAASEPEATESTETMVESDGSLVLYSGRGEDLIAPLIEQFTADTGIEVEVRYGSTGEMSALLLEEGDQSPAQVFLSQDAGALGAITEAGLSSTLPDQIADVVPAGFTSTDDSWVGVTGRARVIAYDGEQLGEADVPDSTDDLTAPEWSGRVAFAPGNASFQSFVTGLRVLEGEEAADEWVAGIAANSPVLTESNGDSLELVNSGTAQLGLINHYYWFEAASEVGAENMRAQLKFLPGDPGGIVNVTGAAILAGAEGDPDALAFVEYLISDAGQKYFVEETYEYPLVPGIDAPEGLPSLESLVNPELDLSDLDSLTETQELLAVHGLI
ncbi:iron ABC transporter substrate-binding protein [Microbacterium lacus]|uniref:iron ABC transporter substrate-binding protein n=1 Tax=Microbacterium lacus TaxID=415217 RepID=UPI000C2C71DE|nr:iron ABC transporter substrate-binding protein [Microbacterium lacus]